MNRNYIPYLRNNEFEDDDYPINHYNTGNDFFTIDKSYNTYESNNNISYYQDHVSEINHIIPQNMNYFDNILIRDNWAALHYRYRSENKQTNEKYVGDRMQFLKFELKEGGYKIVSSWIK